MRDDLLNSMGYGNELDMIYLAKDGSVLKDKSRLSKWEKSLSGHIAFYGNPDGLLKLTTCWRLFPSYRKKAR